MAIDCKSCYKARSESVRLHSSKKKAVSIAELSVVLRAGREAG